MIKVTDKYAIVVDSMNYSIIDYTKPKKKKDGGVEYPYLAHFGEMSGALKRIRKLTINDVLSTMDTTLPEAIAKIQKMDREMESLFAKIDALI